jgi:hypothetical protein
MSELSQVPNSPASVTSTLRFNNCTWCSDVIPENCPVTQRVTIKEIEHDEDRHFTFLEYTCPTCLTKCITTSLQAPILSTSSSSCVSCPNLIKCITIGVADPFTNYE